MSKNFKTVAAMLVAIALLSGAVALNAIGSQSAGTTPPKDDPETIWIEEMPPEEPEQATRKDQEKRDKQNEQGNMPEQEPEPDEPNPPDVPVPEPVNANPGRPAGSPDGPSNPPSPPTNDPPANYVDGSTEDAIGYGGVDTPTPVTPVAPAEGTNMPSHDPDAPNTARDGDGPSL